MLLVFCGDSSINSFNNPDKGAITHAIVHRALWEYLMAVSDTADEVEQEKLRREIYERYIFNNGPFIITDFLSCQDVLAEMVHTRDGSRVVREFIAHGTAKVAYHLHCANSLR
jgi:pumilio homology domain family member 6